MGNNSAKKQSHLKISEEQMNTLLANTSFSREEILQWHEGFIVSLKFIFI